MIGRRFPDEFVEPGLGPDVPGLIFAAGFDPEGEGHDLVTVAIGSEGVLDAMLTAFTG